MTPSANTIGFIRIVRWVLLAIHAPSSSIIMIRLNGSVPSLGVLLANIGDGKTRRQALLELLSLVGVLKNEGVYVLRASDLELDVVDLLVLLYAGRAGILAPADLDELLDIGDFGRANFKHLKCCTLWLYLAARS